MDGRAQLPKISKNEAKSSTSSISSESLVTTDVMSGNNFAYRIFQMYNVFWLQVENISLYNCLAWSRATIKNLVTVLYAQCDTSKIQAGQTNGI